MTSSADDKGASGTKTLTVTVKLIPTTITLDPKTLNLKSQGQCVIAYVELPKNYDVNKVDIKTVKLNGTFRRSMTRNKVRQESGDQRSRWRRLPELMVKIDLTTVQQLLQPGQAMLKVSGKVLYNGNLSDFEGTDTISVTS